jgi:hypothetical protein
MKAEHIFVTALFILAVIGLYVLCQAGHELIHYWQDDFQGNEICFMGSDNLTDITGSRWGWYMKVLPYDANRILPNARNREIEAYFMQFSLFFIGSLILTLMWFKAMFLISIYEMENWGNDRGEEKTEKEV